VRLVGVGLSHHTAPIDVRERLAASTKPIEQALLELTKVEAVQEACIVSTCNRVEFYVGGDAEAPALAREVRRFICTSTGLPPSEIEPHLYSHEGVGGLRHLFRVASSLDSMVLGEPQILGQVKEAFGTAITAGAVGAALRRAVARAFLVAKRVRTETGVAENAVSMSFAAVELGREIFESLAGKNVLLVGAGKMSTLAAKHLRSNGIQQITVANRSLDRAQALADDIGGSASSLTDLSLLLQRADIVISSTAAPEYVVTKKLMAKVVRNRRYRPILFVDIAVPRDIDPDVGDLENVFVYDVDDLQEVVEDNREARAKEAGLAEDIIHAEVDRYVRWARTQQVVPVIKALRAQATEIANAEVARTVGILDGHPKAQAKVRAMSHSIVNKMLHPVMKRLKAEGAEGDPSPLIESLLELFALDIDVVEEAPADDSTNVVPFAKKDGTK